MLVGTRSTYPNFYVKSCRVKDFAQISDKEIITAAYSVLNQSSGVAKTVTATDVYRELGFNRPLGIWDNKEKYLSRRRIITVLMSEGFERVECNKARLYLPNSSPMPCIQIKGCANIGGIYE